MLESLEGILTSDFFKLFVAFVLSLPIAYNRENSTQIMGLRTFPLVAISTCGYVLIGMTFIDADSKEAHARIIQGIAAGIGFIGGGAILKGEQSVKGTASAASIWTTGAIGVAAAHARYDIAFVLALANFLILRGLTPLKRDLDEGSNEQVTPAS